MPNDTATQIDELIDKLSAAFEHDPWINLHRSPVELRNEDGRLVMEGKVENLAALRRARVLADTLVKDRWPIDDRLRREPTEAQGDRQIRDKVMELLSTESMFREYSLSAKTADKTDIFRDADDSMHEILVHVAHAAVKLTGSVGSLTHRRVAEVLVWWAYGCETVNNCLEVMPAEEDSDNEITDAVRIVLEKDPMLDADQFHIKTSDHVVTLEGLATSEMAKKYVVLDVWAVAGVWDVVDRVTVEGSGPE